MRRPLAVLLFFLAVIGFTFLSTLVHEVAHAAAWDASEPPKIIFADSRDEARHTVASEKSMHIEGRAYRVMEVERTTIALYPKTILVTGATLGIAPATMLPDPVLASTFYALDDADYAALAAGHDPTAWDESAMPMIVNGMLAIPVWIWLMWRPHAISMAAAWASAAEWRYNVHHAEEVGINATLYLGASLLVMAITAGVITFLAFGGWSRVVRPRSGRPVHAATPSLPMPTHLASPAPPTPARVALPAPPTRAFVATPVVVAPGRVTSPGRTLSRTARLPSQMPRTRGSAPTPPAQGRNP